MTSKMDRRLFLKHAGAAGAGLGLLGCGRSLFAAEGTLAKGAPNAEKLGWRLGGNTYTFQLFPLFEALDKIASLGLKYVEFGPGQRFSKEDSTVVSDTMPQAARKVLKKKAADLGLNFVTYSTMDFFKDAMPAARRLNSPRIWARKISILKPAKTNWKCWINFVPSTASTSPSITIPSPLAIGAPKKC